MANDTSLSIRILSKENDRIKDSREEYDVAEFGGEVPQIGDLIIDPGIEVKSRDSTAEDRFDLSRRTVHEVIARYFRPGALPGDANYVEIIVKSRHPTDAELELL